MKNARKNLFKLMFIIILPMLLVGCKPKINADESAKVWFNYLIKGELTDITKIGITEDEAIKLKQTQKDAYIKALKTGFETGKLKITDAQLEQIYVAHMSTLNLITVTTEAVSQTSKISEVKIKSTYITNDNAAYEKAALDASNQLTALNITNEEELNNKFSETFINTLIKELKDIKASKDTKDKTFKFIIKNRRWVPENNTAFASDVAKMASGK